MTFIGPSESKSLELNLVFSSLLLKCCKEASAYLPLLLYSLFVNSATFFLRYLHLCFANDMRIYVRNRSLDNCILLQDYINRFFDWGNTLGLTLNIAKCQSMIQYVPIKLLVVTSFSLLINDNSINY
jgi:hypothetical protein